MKAHELARKLLEMPDYEVEVCAHGHRYHSYIHKNSHGPLDIRISVEDGWNGKAVPSISIGDMLDYTFRVDKTETLQAPLDGEEYADRIRLRDERARELGEHNRRCMRQITDALKEHFSETAAAFYDNGGEPCNS